MAQTTMTLACTGSALLDQQNPSTNYHGSASYEIIPEYRTGSQTPTYKQTILCLGFESFPSALRRKKLYSAVVTDYYTASNESPTGNFGMSVYVSTCDKFDESAVTYRNRPTFRARVGATSFRTASAFGAISPASPCAFPDGSSYAADQNAHYVLQTSAVAIEGQYLTYSGSRIFLNARTATNKPILTVTYDDSVDIQYKVEGNGKTSGKVSRISDQTFLWKIVKETGEGYCVAAPVQASAVFQWRTGTSGSWNSVPVNGETASVTIPAGTFTGSTTQWRVTVTDDMGDVRTSATYTIDTSVDPLTAMPSSPISGAFADPLEPIVFTWINTSATGSAQTGADIQYSTDGSSWSLLAASTSSSPSVTIQSGFFSTGTYYWRVRSYNADGVAGNWSTSEQFTTVDAPMYAAPLSPVSEICEYTAPITFKWRNYSDTGTTPTASSVQWSSDLAIWHTLASLGANVLEYTAAANTFPAGTIYWRARCSNHNGVAGDWSEAVSFISYGAPAVPSVSVDAVPFATINWQSAGQIGWRVTVDGKLYGPRFGTDKTLTLDEPLEDGAHSVSVEIQGAFGLWSQPGTADFSIQNNPGDPIYLSGRFAADAELNWETRDDVPAYRIYRDGSYIARTAATEWLDRLCLGEHEWKILAELPGGYYAFSNTVTGKVSGGAPRIAKFPDGEWVELRLSAASEREKTSSFSRTVSLRHVLGAEFPVLEMAPFRDITVTFDAAFPDKNSAKAFESLRGQVVMLKTCEDLTVGCLSSLQKMTSIFYAAYQFSLQQIHWEDFIDDTGA